MAKNDFFDLLNQGDLEEAISLMRAQFQDDPVVQFQLGRICKRLEGDSDLNELRSGLATLYRFGDSRMALV
ncbi:MAG: hypothetical protein AAF206_22395 [Bacteroidota bacterium]